MDFTDYLLNTARKLSLFLLRFLDRLRQPAQNRPLAPGMHSPGFPGTASNTPAAMRRRPLQST